MPVPALFPDIEAVLVPWLQAQLLAVLGVTARTCTETPVDLATAVPLVAISRSAGGDVQAILDRPVADIDCFAADRLSAQKLASQVHMLMHHYLPGSVTGGAVIGYVSTVKGPGWLPYQDVAVRRSNATYEIYCHPVPGP